MSRDADYGRAFALWRDSAPEQWEAYTRHRFVQALGDGSLPRSAFLHYLRQDYVFLVHYSRAWALAVAKSSSLEEMKVAATTVDALVNHEMRLHVEVCAAEGIAEAQLFEVREAPQNLAYTRYVLDSGYSGGFLDLMAALSPCAMGYGEIGLALAAEASSDAYRPWIDTYAGEEYQDVCAGIGAMIDSALEERLGPRFADAPCWSALCRTFRTAAELEAGFWDMGLEGT